jgi:hypothetical protein
VKWIFMRFTLKKLPSKELSAVAIAQDKRIFPIVARIGATKPLANRLVDHRGFGKFLALRAKTP